MKRRRLYIVNFVKGQKKINVFRGLLLTMRKGERLLNVKPHAQTHLTRKLPLSISFTHTHTHTQSLTLS
jgi:hypothetical protein